ncbi:MAG: tetratricopeptide repeat protein [Parachlamydiales bacterium]|jgi:outer membrane protein assembly factor BamD (BamD/ComL family)
MRYFTLLIIIISSCILPLDAGVKWKDGRWIDTAENPSLYSDEHYKIACEEFNCGKWKDAAKHFRIITCNYANSEYGPNAAFFLGICEFHLCEYEDANKALNCYLRHRTDSTHFFEAIEYKFCIADIYANGHKRRLFCYNTLPKLVPGYSYAIEVYDEIIFALPNHEMAAQALFSKATLLAWLGNYRESVDTYQVFLRRFPKHSLAPECYVNIINNYLWMAQTEYQNPDLLSFAQLTYIKFAKVFPRDENLPVAQALVMDVKETYASGFYELGRYYERSGWDRAAAIYYNACAEQFPDTNIAARSRDKLAYLGWLLPPAATAKVSAEIEDNSNCIPSDIEFD